LPAEAHGPFRTRQRTGVAHELIVFAVLNGIGLPTQDATVAFNSYLLNLEHNNTADFIALSPGIALSSWAARVGQSYHP